MNCIRASPSEGEARKKKLATSSFSRAPRTTSSLWPRSRIEFLFRSSRRGNGPRSDLAPAHAGTFSSPSDTRAGKRARSKGRSPLSLHLVTETFRRLSHCHQRRPFFPRRETSSLKKCRPPPLLLLPLRRPRPPPSSPPSSPPSRPTSSEQSSSPTSPPFSRGTAP